MQLDIQANRAAKKFSRHHMFRRIVWAGIFVLFRWSPRPFFGWRRFLLRSMGAKVGRYVNVYSSTWIHCPWLLQIGDYSSIGEFAYIYNIGLLTVGERATISQHAYLCTGTHDYTDPTLPLVTQPICVGNDAWVCANAFLGPGVCVGDGAIVGACAAAFCDVAPWTIVGGNPARFIKERRMAAAT